MESIQNAFPKLLTNKFDIGSGNGSAGRKRSFNESNESYVDYDSPARKQYHRFSKQPHRGWETGQGKGSRPRFTGVDNPQRGRDIGTARIPDSTTAIAMGSRPNDLRGGFRNQHQISASLPPTIHSLGTLAFDPNAALQAVMTLQAMGFPFPFPGPATEAGDSNVKVRLQKLCRNYNSKGYCSRGDKCHFKHDKSEITGNVENSKDSLTGSVSINAPHKRDSSLNGKPSKRGFVRTDGTRAVFSSTVIHGNRENFTGVVVEAIPEDCFDNNKIRGFFSKFGTIKNIIMRAYHHLAIVEYEDHASARMAFESPKVVFDNRFVKVFWYIPALDDKRASSVVETGPDVKLEEPQVDRKQFEADNELAQKKYQARQVLLKETDQKRLELAAKQKEIELKKVQEIQKMKDILAANGKILPADIESPTKNTTKEEETANLLAQLKALEDEAQSLGLESEPWSSHGLGHNNRGRGSYQGWRGYSTRSRGWGAYGRGGFIGNGAYNLDNRPKRVKVESAVEFDDAMDESLKRFLFVCRLRIV